ncbi:MAG: hypothetical protein LC800_19495 [Acidobacteria bacterium]|nr:hypothetical protein [Acidobacteriota bacterium]
MLAEAEIWQVMCGKEIYQADTDTLKQWIAEGVVLPTDQVRKGNLRWLDAARVPSLRPVFAGEESPAPPAAPAPPQQQQQPAPPFAATPPVTSPAAPSHAARPFAAGVYHAPAGTDAGAGFAGATSQAMFADDSHVAAEAGFGGWQPGHDPFYRPAAGRAAEEEAGPVFVPDQKDFAARAADAPSPHALGTACYNHPQAAPKYVCRVCQTPMCAACPKFVDGSKIALCPLCGDFCNRYEEVRERAFRQVRKAGGFGFSDFKQAVLYPFKNVVGLVGVSILYSLLALGGMKGQILAYVVIFGCMSLVIKQMAWGRFDRGFLPDFSSMSLWDDVAVPCFLGLGISLVTIGPAVLLFLALFFGVVGGGPSVKERTAADIEAKQQQMAEQMGKMTDPNATGEEVEESLAAFNKSRAEALPGGADESNSDAGMIRSAAAGSLLLALLLLAALAWAFFYYPMALVVAGFTEDFWSVVNPSVGLDTIRRMGWNYAKAFLMYTSVQAVSLVFGLVSMIALSAFDMPLVGNIPARFIEGGFNFYASLVIAALLGLALYKSSDRLGIATD